MKQCLYILLTVLSIIVITTISFSNTTEQSTQKALPLTKGNYWIYQGKIQWENQPTYENVLGECGEIADYYLYSNTLEEKIFTWKMEVLESYEFGNIKVALLNNDFTNLSLENLNLASSNEGNPNRAFVIISVDEQKYYLITDEFAEKVIDKARNNNFDFTDLKILQEEDLILSLPLKANSYFGRSKENNVETQLNKTSESSNDCLAWCWKVNKVNKVNEEQNAKIKVDNINIIGLNSSNPINEYFLSWSFNNGVVSKEFVPTVGFTQYTSLYHGPSLYERISLDLIDYKIN